MSKLKKAIDKCRSNFPICMILTVLSFCGTAYGVVWLSQYILEAGMENMNAGVLHLNALCAGIVFFLIYTVTLKTKVSLIAGSLLLLILSTANYYTFAFRGNEMVPSDILAVGTAMSVAGNYTFTFGKNIVIPWFCFLDFALYINSRIQMEEYMETKSALIRDFVDVNRQLYFCIGKSLFYLLA